MQEPTAILQEYWGYSTFRPLQEDIIRSVLEGKDTLALLPTGGGKSICFQVPALCRDGVCVVISPLIALMKDQVYNLQKRGIPAKAIFSGMAHRDIDRILDEAVNGHLKFLYLSPERLTTELAIERIKRMNINLLAIDEAHCVSQWGYDFRPPYLNIAAIRVHLPNTPILALTATATPEVVIDIQEKLAFRRENIFQKSFSRSNLAYVIVESDDKIAKTVDILKKVPGSGVVYVRSRRKTKEIAFFLQQNGIVADYYHAGLGAEERSEKQEAWINDRTRIMVSTNAFGMGIDKPNVRTVVHIDVPDNMEAYFQEAGRGGRDELKAYAVLLWNKYDETILKNGYETSFPPVKTIRQVYRALGSYFQLGIGSGEGESYDFDLVEFAKNFRFDNQLEVLSALKVLEQAGWIAMTESVFIPSSLLLKLNREEFYAFQLRNRKYEAILKTVTRAYEGVFSAPTFINESALAHAMRINKDELVRLLEILKKEGVLDYYPKKDKPQLTFLKERLNADDITIDTKLYQFRKERYLFRIEKMIAYLNTPKCRSRMLLDYFGETDASKCGTCDFCLDEKKHRMNDEDFERYKEKIVFLLKKEILTIRQIVDSFATNRQEKVLKTLEYLIEEGFLKKDGDKISL